MGYSHLKRSTSNDSLCKLGGMGGLALTRNTSLYDFRGLTDAMFEAYLPRHVLISAIVLKKGNDVKLAYSP